MDAETSRDQVQANIGAFQEFLQADRYGYPNKVLEMIRTNSNRLIINLNDLRDFDNELTGQMMRRPLPLIVAFQIAIENVAKNEDPSYGQKLLSSKSQHTQQGQVDISSIVKVGFEGSFGSHHVSPRGLTSRHLCSLVCIEGIVTKCSLVRPKLVKSVHYCPATKLLSSRDYRDATALDIGLDITGGGINMPTSSVYPTQDSDGNMLETEFGMCIYKDHQCVTIQEMPERAPLGQLPRSIDIILEQDLVDAAKPGDRVQCIGVYRALAGSGSGGSGAGAGAQTSGIFRTVILANRVRVLGRDTSNVRVSPGDVSNIRSLCHRPDILPILGRSLSPSIYGHEEIKQALILLLLGGCEKNLPNGAHLRGDLNIMMVGDPSTAKSQLLRSVMKVAPLAISTTGRGSSGVGLTAAVTTDQETGERRLEAGAMVLADRGVVCIDEFDKMSELDRVAIHEVMEQQTVTIAKASIHAQLNARCSVVAAANPVYGQYDKSKRPQENIGLPDSLLSRFDLLFIVLDQPDPEVDRKISDHVLKAHSYRPKNAASASSSSSLFNGRDMTSADLAAGTGGGGASGRDDSDIGGGSGNGGDGVEVWAKGKHPKQLHLDGDNGFDVGGVDGDGDGDLGTGLGVMSQDFLKRYIHFAKHRINPVLTAEATEEIANAYADLRTKHQEIAANANAPTASSNYSSNYNSNYSSGSGFDQHNSNYSSSSSSSNAHHSREGSNGSDRTLPVTARMLETIIRLSTAHAKARLSPRVEVADCEGAMRLLSFALYQEKHHNTNTYTSATMRTRTLTPATTGADAQQQREQQRSKKRSSSSSGGGGDMSLDEFEGEEDEEGDSSSRGKRKSKSKRGHARRKLSHHRHNDGEDEDEDDSDDEITPDTNTGDGDGDGGSATSSVSVSASSLASFTSALNNLLSISDGIGGDGELSISELIEKCNISLAAEGRAEVDRASAMKVLKELERKNRLMVNEAADTICPI